MDNGPDQGCSEYFTYGGGNTRDRVFLLSCAEAAVYAEVRQQQSAPWWLRSTGRFDWSAAVIIADGSTDSMDAWSEGVGVRPAMWLDLSADGVWQLLHVWQEPDESGLLLCEVCGQSLCEVHGHELTEADCRQSAVCGRCGWTDGVAGEHIWQAASFSAPRTCRTCGLTEGTAVSADTLQTGDRIAFGTYWQDPAAEEIAPIEWVVLSTADGKALLLSSFSLTARQYAAYSTGITWEWSSLRTWLNSEFLPEAFTAEEQALIVQTEVDNSAAQCCGSFASYGGSETLDRVFLLSWGELSKYPEAAAGADSCWWLRSPGALQSEAICICPDGTQTAVDVGSTAGVRPAVWIRLP